MGGKRRSPLHLSCKRLYPAFPFRLFGCRSRIAIYDASRIIFATYSLSHFSQIPLLGQLRPSRRHPLISLEDGKGRPTAYAAIVGLLGNARSSESTSSARPRNPGRLALARDTPAPQKNNTPPSSRASSNLSGSEGPSARNRILVCLLPWLTFAVPSPAPGSRPIIHPTESAWRSPRR